MHYIIWYIMDVKITISIIHHLMSKSVFQSIELEYKHTTMLNCQSEIQSGKF